MKCKGCQVHYVNVELLEGGDTAGGDLLLTDVEPGMAAGMLSVHVMTQVPAPPPLPFPGATPRQKLPGWGLQVSGCVGRKV